MPQEVSLARHLSGKFQSLTVVVFLVTIVTMAGTIAALSQALVRKVDQALQRTPVTREASAQQVLRNHTQKRRSGAVPQDQGNPLFLPPVNYETGTYPEESVAVADLNGDGKADLVVASQGCFTCGDGSVSVLLGNGDGTFQPFVAYDSGGVFTYSVAVADANRDGKPDIIVTNYYGECTSEDCDGTVSVLIGNGDGTFLPAVIYDLPSQNPDSIVVADLNNDGKPDLVVGNWNSGVAVMLGNGDGTFQPAVPYAEFGNFSSVAVADVNHDGKLDVVADGSNQAGGVVSVLLGNGDGTLQPAVNYASGAPSGYWANSVAVADLRGDGKLDVVVANYLNSVGVLLGNGDGSFQPAVLYNTGGLAAYAAVVDVNGDGKPDVVVSNVTGNSPGSVGVLLGNGDGTFQSVVSFGAFNAAALAIADVNGDGRPDLAVTTASEYLQVLLNNTGPHTPTTTTLASSANPARLKQTVTYTAEVTSQSSTASGTVTFQDNGVTIATVRLSDNRALSSASYPTKSLHSITATYSGDLKNGWSTSPVLTEEVGKAPYASVTTLATSGSPSLQGQP